MWNLSELHVPIPFEGMEEALEEATRRGVSAELQGMYAPARLACDFEKNLERIESAFRGFEGRVSLHSPFFDLNPVSEDPDVASLARRRYEQAVEIADAAGADILLFHSQCSVFIRDPNYLNWWLERSIALWSGWKGRLEESGRMIVFENVFEPDCTPISRLIDGLGNPRFRACLDLGHAHLFSGDAPSWVTSCSSRIAYVHLHDNDGLWDLHLPPGDGEADLEEALRKLGRLPERPRINPEVFSRQGVLRAIEWLGEKGFLSKS